MARVHKADIAHWNDKMDTRGCLGCVAREKGGTCKFMGIFGVSRIVLNAPTYPGGGCRLKRDKDGNHMEVVPKSWINSAHKPRCVEWDTKKAEELYKQGAYDKEIADALGISKATVFRWRNSLDLPPNKSRCSKSSQVDSFELAEELYAQGLNDAEIARQLGNGIQHYNVRDWRIKTNRPANCQKEKLC